MRVVLDWLVSWLWRQQAQEARRLLRSRFRRGLVARCPQFYAWLAEAGFPGTGDLIVIGTGADRERFALAVLYALEQVVSAEAEALGGQAQRCPVP